jgi:hypothetical protein
LQIAFKRNPEGEIQDLRIDLQNGEIRYLRERLSQLVACLGMRLWLPFGDVPAIALVSLLDGMIQAGILSENRENVCLGNSFLNAVFESRYYQMLVKSPKPWRAKLVDVLQN